MDTLKFGALRLDAPKRQSDSSALSRLWQELGAGRISRCLQRVFVFLSINGLGLHCAVAQVYCDPSVPPISMDSWLVSNAANVPFEVAFYRGYPSLEALLSAVEAAKYRQSAASGDRSFSMTRALSNSSNTFWDYVGVDARGNVFQSNPTNQIAVYTSGNQPLCPNGYRYTGPNCTLINENLRECPNKPKPDKERKACGAPTEGNPCNVASGNKLQREVDYKPSETLSPRFIRYYSSDLGTPRGSLGAQWRAEYDRSLMTGMSMPFRQSHDSSKEIFIQRPEGNYIPFRWNGAAYVPRDSDAKEKLVQIDNLTFQFTTSDEVVETYVLSSDVSIGLLRSINERGYVQTMSYASNNTLSSVTDSYGRMLTFVYDGS